MVASALSTAAAVALGLALAAALGPTLGRWSTDHRLARFLVGLLTELRMLPVLVALVPLLEARSGLPAFAIIGSMSGASRIAAVARWTSHAETAQRGSSWASARPSTQGSWAGTRLRAAAGAAAVHATFEVALLEGLNTFFGEGHGPGLGADLVRGQLGAVVPLIALAWAATAVLDGNAARLWQRSGR